ncbi:MAG TPA: hypothetical protein VMJ32_18110 [Pirellulales bacterium]|nr:hypothetical protein [Pirellulales bacterium]
MITVKFTFPACFLCIGLALATDFSAAAAQSTPDVAIWAGGSGNWNQANLWSNGLPNGYLRAEVHGKCTVTVPAGDYVIGDLEIGLNPHDRARVEVDGGQLILMQDSLRIGEETGGEGEFVLKDGAMHCFMDVYAGAATGVPGCATKATLRIQGGSFLGRTLLAGIG